MNAIRVGDTVTSANWAFTGTVVKIQVSNSAGPNYATVEFISTGNIPGTYRQVHTVDKLERVN